MPKVAVNLDIAGGATHSTQTFATDTSKAIITEGDVVEAHPFLHGTATFVKPDFFFKINGKSVIINGDAATCGHTIVASGFVNVIPSEE